MFIAKYKSYKVGSKFYLDQKTIDSLVEIFDTENHDKPEIILTGRNTVKEITIPALGSLVIKKYLRGGLISRFNKDNYLYSKKSRSELEFDVLIKALKAGVNVPEPIAHITKKFLFYKAWLITRKIEPANNFIEFCLHDKKKAVSLLPEICQNIYKLIENSIHHKDLHPGNIIIDEFNKPYILDFDKACYFAGNKGKLTIKYKQRWKRAIKKYNLSDSLSDLQIK